MRKKSGMFLNHAAFLIDFIENFGWKREKVINFH